MALKRGRASMLSVNEGHSGRDAIGYQAEEKPAAKRQFQSTDVNVDPVLLLLGSVPSGAVQKDLRDQVLCQLARSISSAAAPEDLSTFLRELQLGIVQRREAERASSTNGCHPEAVPATKVQPLPSDAPTACAFLPRRRGSLVLAPASWGPPPQPPGERQVLEKSTKAAVGRRQLGPLPPVPSFTDDRGNRASGGSSSSSSTAPSAGAPKAAAAAPASEGHSDSAMDPAEALERMISELADRPISQEGVLDEARLERVVLQLLKCGLSFHSAEGLPLACRRWAQVWHAMQVPVELQVSVVIALLRLGLKVEAQAEGGQCRASVIAQLVTELVKGHRVKLRSLEQALRGYVAQCAAPASEGDDAWLTAIDACSRSDRDSSPDAGSGWRRAQLLCAHVFVHLFPRPAQAGWGWSRIGWSWATWWACVGRIFEEADRRASFSVIVLSLSLMQERTGMPLLGQDAWEDTMRVSKLHAKLLELSAVEDAELDLLLLRAGISLFSAEAEASGGSWAERSGQVHVGESTRPADELPAVIILDDDEEQETNGFNNVQQEAEEAEDEAASLHADIRRLELQIATYSDGNVDIKADDMDLEEVAEEEEEEEEELEDDDEELTAMAEDVVQEVAAADADLE